MRNRSNLPFRITLALCLVLIMTAWNLARLWTSIAWRSTLEIYASSPGPLYIGLTGALWGAVGALLAWATWSRQRWALQALLGASAAYAAWAWADRLMVQAQIGANWPFAILMTVVVLGYVIAVAIDPRNRAYFGKEAHERQNKN
jgi:hypothetical protein